MVRRVAAAALLAAGLASCGRPATPPQVEGGLPPGPVRLVGLAGFEWSGVLPLLREGRREGHPHLCWSISGHRAVREGALKLVAPPNKPWELYDLSRDRTELDDLAPAQPETVERLAKIHESWLKR